MWTGRRRRAIKKRKSKTIELAGGHFFISPPLIGLSLVNPISLSHKLTGNFLLKLYHFFSRMNTDAREEGGRESRVQIRNSTSSLHESKINSRCQPPGLTSYCHHSWLHVIFLTYQKNNPFMHDGSIGLLFESLFEYKCWFRTRRVSGSREMMMAWDSILSWHSQIW